MEKKFRFIILTFILEYMIIDCRFILIFKAIKIQLSIENFHWDYLCYLSPRNTIFSKKKKKEITYTLSIHLGMSFIYSRHSTVMVIGFIPWNCLNCRPVHKESKILGLVVCFLTNSHLAVWCQIFFLCSMPNFLVGIKILH